MSAHVLAQQRDAGAIRQTQTGPPSPFCGRGPSATCHGKRSEIAGGSFAFVTGALLATDGRDRTLGTGLTMATAKNEPPTAGISHFCDVSCGHLFPCCHLTDASGQ